MIPLYGFLEGDSLGLLILGNEDEPLSKLAERLQSSASVRVAPKACVCIMHAGKVLDPNCKLRHSGLKSLDRFDVVEVSA
jgi:hypothetical protein